MMTSKAWVWMLCACTLLPSATAVEGSSTVAVLASGDIAALASSSSKKLIRSMDDVSAQHRYRRDDDDSCLLSDDCYKSVARENGVDAECPADPEQSIIGQVSVQPLAAEGNCKVCKRICLVVNCEGFLHYPGSHSCKFLASNQFIPVSQGSHCPKIVSKSRAYTKDRSQSDFCDKPPAQTPTGASLAEANSTARNPEGHHKIMEACYKKLDGVVPLEDGVDAHHHGELKVHSKEQCLSACAQMRKCNNVRFCEDDGGVARCVMRDEVLQASSPLSQAGGKCKTWYKVSKDHHGDAIDNLDENTCV